MILYRNMDRRFSISAGFPRDIFWGVTSIFFYLIGGIELAGIFMTIYILKSIFYTNKLTRKEVKQNV